MPQCKQRTQECSHQRIEVIAQVDQNVASKSRPNISFKVLTKMHLQNLDKNSNIKGAFQDCPSKAINYPSYSHQPQVQKPGKQDSIATQNFLRQIVAIRKVFGFCASGKLELE